MNWLESLAPYCGELARDKCPNRPSHRHMCEGRPSHERGEIEHHVCGCGHGWTTAPRVRA